MRNEGLIPVARSNDYSVPTKYGFRNALAKGFVDEVVIFCEGLEISPHALLEQKPGALDQAAPPQGGTLPETLTHMRRLLEGRMGRRGKREFIHVLQLTEVFTETVVIGAALEAIGIPCNRIFQLMRTR